MLLFLLLKPIELRLEISFLIQTLSRSILKARFQHAKNEMSKDFTRKHGLVKSLDFTGISSPFETPENPDILG